MNINHWIGRDAEKALKKKFKTGKKISGRTNTKSALSWHNTELRESLEETRKKKEAPDAGA